LKDFFGFYYNKIIESLAANFDFLRFLGNGVNPSHVFRKKGQRSALHAAALGGDLVAVHVLVQAGAQIDHLDADLTSPLMLAVTEGHSNIVRYLIKAGASVAVRVSSFTKSTN